LVSTGDISPEVNIQTKEERKSERDRFLFFEEKQRLKDQRQTSSIYVKE